MSAANEPHAPARDETPPTGLMAAARLWLAQDPDPDTRAELTALIEREDLAALRDRFGTKLEFGTAGLRGELGAG